MQVEEFLVDAVGLDAGLASLVGPNVRLVNLERGDHLLHVGERQRGVGFLVSGVVRSYTISPEGRDDTDCLVVEPGSILAHCGELDEPSPINIEALAPSSVAMLDMGIVKRLLESDPQASQFYIRALQDSLRVHWEVKAVVTQHDAHDRYLWFVEKYPGLEDRIPDRYIASFLKMTTVTLSRTRSAVRTCPDDRRGRHAEG